MRANSSSATAAIASIVWLRSGQSVIDCGPFKLNWVGDIGSAVVVGGCAAYYSAVVLAPPRRSKPGGPA